MFDWLLPRARCSPIQAHDRIRHGKISRPIVVNGALDLRDSAWLTYLPREIEAVSIDVSGCANLRGLPERICCRDLFVRRTNIECLPTGLDVANQLVASNCHKLERVFPFRVPELRLRNCVSLVALPERLQVERLTLSGCTRLRELPASLTECAHDLDLSGCTSLEQLPRGFKCLETLNLSGCTRLTSLPPGIKVRSSMEVAGSGLQGRPGTLRSTRLLWRGAQVSDRIAFEPESITVDEILSELNLEWRRVLLERVGMEWFVANSEASVIDQDEDAGGQRRLLRVRFQNGHDVVCLDVQCPSTGHCYILQVPPDMHTCTQSAAWIAGFNNASNYRPVVET